MCVCLVWKRRYADVRAGTQAPPLRFRLGRLRADSWFCWGITRGWLVSFGQITRGRLVAFVWIARGRLVSFLHYSARMPLRIPLFMLFISVAFIFSMDSDEGI